MYQVLGSDFAISQNPHMRKGGLIGLAAMAIGLGKLLSVCLSVYVGPTLLHLTYIANYMLKYIYYYLFVKVVVYS